jgi:tetratricopeptide (TPR) repeat protein
MSNENNDCQQMIGLNALSNMFIELSSNNYDEDKKNMIERALEINPFSSDALEALAMYYELDVFDYNETEKFYLDAIALDPKNTRILYNFANFYEDRKDYPNMVKYYELCSEEYDCDALFQLAVYYFNICKDKETGLNYYMRGIELISEDFNDKIIKNKKYKDIRLLEILEDLEAHDNSSENFKLFMNKIKSVPEIMAYKNKIKLFTRLQNICECQICFDNKLNIDLPCGHEVCIDCYKIIYKSNCPWCRSPTYNL